MVVIRWRNKITGDTGQSGTPIDESTAREIVSENKNRHPDIEYELVPIDSGMHTPFFEMNPARENK